MKLYIVGAVASGKSTLARRLSETSNILSYSLDEVVHISDKAHPWGNHKRSVEERNELFRSIISQNQWIIEDTGRPCFEDALKDADLIVLLEISKWNRKYRIIKRWIKQQLGIEKCIYKPRFDMLKWMLKWSKDYDTGRDNLKERILGYKEKVVTIRNNQDTKNFTTRYLANSNQYSNLKYVGKQGNMEIAVLADIHSNYVALERCLTYAFSRNIKTFIFLGDYVAELAFPQRTMQRLYDLSKEYQCYFIKGNKEEYWLNYRSSGEKGWSDRNSTTGALLYAYNELTPKDLDFFEQMQPALEVTIPGYPTLTICHGSPFNVNEKMLPDDLRTSEIMDSVDTSTILCGHTHAQRKIVNKNKYALNPGAVGISHCSQGKTQFLILHGNNDEWAEEFISLEYDVEKVIRELHEGGLYEHAPYWSLITESNLRGGNVSHGTVLIRAMELCRKETGKCIWPDIPEHCWAEAVKEKITN